MFQVTTAIVLAAGLVGLSAPPMAGATLAEGVRVLAPAEDALVHASEVLLVYTAPSGVGALYQVDGEAVDLPEALVPGDREDLHHVRVSLTEGDHQVRVLDRRDERELAALRVTVIPPYSLRTPTLSGAKPYAFHGRERESTCAGCHSLPDVFETVPDRPLAPAGKVCGACHPQVERHASLHGPVAVYACFMCHEPEYRPTRFQQKSSQASLCSTCHEGFLAKVLGGKKFVHGPVAAGGCLVCHDPHGGEGPSLVRGTPAKLCLLCHAETLPLPVERSLHGPVPCTQCHNPHGGQTPFLTDTAGNPFCGRCHQDVLESAEGHPIAGHPVAAEVDPSHPGKPLGCISCHDPHSLRDVSKVKLLQNETAQRQFCRRCHY